MQNKSWTRRKLDFDEDFDHLNRNSHFINFYCTIRAHELLSPSSLRCMSCYYTEKKCWLFWGRCSVQLSSVASAGKQITKDILKENISIVSPASGGTFNLHIFEGPSDTVATKDFFLFFIHLLHNVQLTKHCTCLIRAININLRGVNRGSGSGRFGLDCYLSTSSLIIENEISLKIIWVQYIHANRAKRLYHWIT